MGETGLITLSLAYKDFEEEDFNDGKYSILENSFDLVFLGNNIYNIINYKNCIKKFKKNIK